MKRSRLIESFCIGIIFFVIGITDLQNYGPNWDEPAHFLRGQALLHYFLTGQKNYQDVPTSLVRRSYYQMNYYSYSYFEQKFDEGKFPIIGAGHPPLSDIIATISNKFFYQKLGIMGDIESYHLYSVSLGALLVGIIYLFTSSMYGSFVGVVSALSLFVVPLFLGESRFNIKDIPETVFYTITIVTFYLGIKNNNWKLVLASSFFTALAFSTKLNIVFAILSIGIWMIIYFMPELSKKGIHNFVKKYKRFFIALFGFPVLPIVIYFGSWPILWKDPIGRFLYNLHYYDVMATTGGTSRGLITLFGINTYALQWILFSTPLIVLFLTIIGLVRATFGVRRNAFFLLLLVWFLMPIIRVSLPGFVIYGGVRQIMEYIPAMAILAGIGAGSIITWVQKRWQRRRITLLIQLFIIASFLPITVKMIQMHPNESIYFNPLIGGLKGAAARNISGWGNSLGSTYRLASQWMNAHAEPDSKLAFVYELRSNIPIIDLRSDIKLSNDFQSAILRKGEYIVGVTHEGTQENSYHRKYLERFLNPVYTVSVEGVPVLKIWKNDLEHTKPEYRKEQTLIDNPEVAKQNGDLIINLRNRQKVTKIVVHYPVSKTCSPPIKGYFQHSLDGIFWENEPEDFSTSPLAKLFLTNPEPGTSQFLFAAEPTQYIKFVILDKNSCLLEDSVNIQVSII